MLDPEAGSVAVSVHKTDAGQSTVFLNSYFFLPDEHRNKRVSRVVARLDEARAAFGSKPVKRDKKLHAKSAELAEALEAGSISVEEAARELAEKAAALNPGKQVWMYSWWAHDLTQLQFDNRTLAAPNLEVGVVVAPVRFEGYPWVVHAIAVVYPEPYRNKMAALP